MDIRGYPWISLDTHGYPLISMDINGYPWISMAIHGYPWISMEFLEVHGTHGDSGTHVHLSKIYLKSIDHSYKTQKRLNTEPQGVKLRIFDTNR